MTRALALACLLLLGCAESDTDTDPPNAYHRIVTLAPQLTELVYAVGAGDRLVGVSDWSDHPPAALELPVVGDAFTVDQERLALLDPDLLLVWESGTPSHTVDELRSAGFTVEVIRTRGLADVAIAMRRIGALTEREDEGVEAAADYSNELASLRDEYGDSDPINVFYQVSKRPLYTINREHSVSELIGICGGINVFDDLTDLAPTA